MSDIDKTTESISDFYSKYYDETSTSKESKTIKESIVKTLDIDNTTAKESAMDNNKVMENSTLDSGVVDNRADSSAANSEEAIAHCESDMAKTESFESKSCDSKYHTLNAIRETRETIKKRLDEYNEKYLKKTVENGRDFIKELNNEPLKKIDQLIDNGTKAAKNLKSDSIKKYDELKDRTKELKEKTREFTAKIKGSPFKAMGDMVKEAKEDVSKKIDKYSAEYKETRKKVVENIEKDAEIIKQDMIDAGKKAIDKIGIKKSIEDKFSSTIEKFPSMLNLPSKKEVEELIKGIDSVNRKVDHLADQFAG